jgi:hypothetical protein
MKQIPSGYLVDKKHLNLTIHKHSRWDPLDKFKSINNHTKLVPSIDLAKAITRQCSFLDKFKNHDLYMEKSLDLLNIDHLSFEASIQNYISFLKLARKDTIIVPTYDIDFIWHTHMRNPLSYREVTMALCGFLLNHDGSIATQTLKDSYRETAARWKMIYNSDYGHNIDQEKLFKSHYLSSCAMIYKHDETNDSGGEGCGGCGG